MIVNKIFKKNKRELNLFDDSELLFIELVILSIDEDNLSEDSTNTSVQRTRIAKR